MGDASRKVFRYHRNTGDVVTARSSGTLPRPKQNNNTHRLLAGIVLYYHADPDLRITVDTQVRMVLVKIVVNGGNDADVFDPRLVLVVLHGELALAGTTDRPE